MPLVKLCVAAVLLRCEMHRIAVFLLFEEESLLSLSHLARRPYEYLRKVVSNIDKADVLET